MAPAFRASDELRDQSDDRFLAAIEQRAIAILDDLNASLQLRFGDAVAGLACRGDVEQRANARGGCSP